MSQRQVRKRQFHVFAKTSMRPRWSYHGTVEHRDAVPALLESCSLGGCAVKVVPSREHAEAVLARLQSESGESAPEPRA